jgi:hypothetical protein
MDLMPNYPEHRMDYIAIAKKLKDKEMLGIKVAMAKSHAKLKQSKEEKKGLDY